VRKIPGYPLWLGHAGDARDPTRLLEAGISAVVCVVANEPSVALPRELVYCRFPLVDGEGNPDWLLRAAVETVACLLRSGTPTLLHCSAGISRSPAVGGAAIALASGCSFAEGLIAATETGATDVSPGLWAAIENSIGTADRRRQD
jgi:protein-tyrosine phosphatase